MPRDCLTPIHSGPVPYSGKVIYQSDIPSDPWEAESMTLDYFGLDMSKRPISESLSVLDILKVMLGR